MLNDLGEVYCWGAGFQGELGDGKFNSISVVPTRVEHAEPFTQLAATRTRTCALTAAGEVYCWGAFSAPDMKAARAVPTLVALPQPATYVGAGYEFACALLQDKTVQCWGRQQNGQLGDAGDRQGRTSAQVQRLEDVHYLSVGAEHSCAINGQGALYCWGSPLDGRLGLDAEAITVAQQVTGFGQAPLIAVSAGGAHTCAIDAAHALYCWGRNGYGQAAGAAGMNLRSPQRVPLEQPIHEISLGYEHTCARAEDGQVSCWGKNDSGQLGTGSDALFDVPGAVLLP